MPGNSKNTWLVTGSLLAIAASAFLIYRQSQAPTTDLRLHQRVGEILAEQTAKILGAKGKLVLLTIPTSGEPQLAAQLAAFRQRIKGLGDFELKEREFDTRNQSKYGLGNGLSAGRFLRTVRKDAKADAIISFIGAPDLSDDQLAQLKQTPKLIIEARSPDHLLNLFLHHLVQAAVVSRFMFPAPGPIRPNTPQEWFDKRYQLLTPGTAGAMLNPE